MKKPSTKTTKRFWLKIPSSFFEHPHMLLLEMQAQHERLQVIWLRLLTFCLKGSPEESEAGILRLTENVPYDERILASVLRVDLDSFRVAFKVFLDAGMVEILDDETIYVEAVQSMIGSETDAAARMRAFRKRKQLAAEKRVTPLSVSSKKLPKVEERSDSGPPPSSGGGPESEELEIEKGIKALEAQAQELKKKRRA